jgi:hypothetical protein
MMSSQKALNVYCDEFVRNLMARCDSIGGKNESLEPILGNLVSVQVRIGQEVLSAFDLFEKDNENQDDKYWAYTLRNNVDSFPLRQIHALNICLGKAGGNGRELQSKKLTILREIETPIVELVVNCNELI